MHYPASTVPQLKAVLRALRKNQGLNQTALGQRLGVNQKRIARIEASPGVTSFDQIARLVSALGGRLTIEVPGDTHTSTTPKPKGATRTTKDTW